MKKKRLSKPAGEAKQKSKTRPPTEEERKLGQVVVDFANAETTDAACYKHFENMQEIMAFSTDFAERLKEAYPAFYPLYFSLTEAERGFIELILGKNADKSHVNQKLETLAYEIDYDPETSILTVWELDAHADVDPDGLVSGGFFRDKQFEMTVEEFKDEYLGSYGSFWDSLDEYIEIEKQISKAKPSFTEGRISELQELSSQYYTLDILHRGIARIQKGLKNILDGIIQGKDFDDISELTHYIEIYNKLPVARVSSRGGVLTENPPIEEKDYLEREKRSWWVNIKWTKTVNQDFAYCLVGFLMPVGNRNYIYRCENCQGYYIPKKIYVSESGLHFCSNPCRMKYHHSKPEYKEKKAAAQREKHGWEESANAK